MKYELVTAAHFLERPNRFVALVETDRGPMAVHVKNTGRCRELLVPGVKVWLSKGINPARKYVWDLIAVEKERPGKPPLLINMDSQAPNQAVGEWLRAGGLWADAAVRAEVVHGTSRFDFSLERDGRRAFLEVKGCTLEEAGAARFPDAPTERGQKHLRELSAWARAGGEAFVLFLVQMGEVSFFAPNAATDPAFAQALREAAQAGVRVLAYDCQVTPDSLSVRSPVEVRLEG